MCLGGFRADPITSKSLMRMEPTRSLRLTWQAKRSSLSDMPTSVSFAYFAPVVAKSFDIAVTDPVFSEKVLPQKRHFHDGLVQVPLTEEVCRCAP